jgi:hypothetical protein
LNCVENRGWLFVAEKIHKEKEKIEKGERRVDRQVIN